MSIARIYSTPKSAMQSGTARTDDWVLEHAPKEAKRIDPLTGWWGSGDTDRQVRLRFGTLDEAIAYARAEGLAYEVEPRRQRPAIRPKAYADNFRTDRLFNWTH
ncbi:ETC complex I subunit conserved region [Roseomonas rosea]|jgi:ETC complex I subunit conserved region|uniref:ETC complex I subunit conserved region n=1 Tax=Muricoccus roseus TaxID=198092 RepID=A0A1M6F540_9PROT|nr:ETC complex I subunit [Roseomonas rosea]SHI92838.1 ETC complex I subunit conserved region [Roseomonas rosea]